MNDLPIPSLKALVVEDQELFREAVADELSYFGFKVTTAEDGEAGLKAIHAETFDLILSDVRMPNKDGRWLLNELRKTQKSAPPFVFMSGFSDLSRQDAFDMGADGFLSKPLNNERLAALLAKLSRPAESRWITQPVDKPLIIIKKQFESLDSPHATESALLGRGGMFLPLPQPLLKTGDLISFDVEFTTGMIRRLEGAGTIMWTRDQEAPELPTGYGIEFDYIADSSRPDWLKYIHSREIVSVIPKQRWV